MGALQRAPHVLLMKGMTSFHSTSKTTNPSPWSEMGMRKPQTSWKNICGTFPAKCPNKRPAAETHEATKAKLFIPLLHNVLGRNVQFCRRRRKKKKTNVYKVFRQVSVCLKPMNAFVTTLSMDILLRWAMNNEGQKGATQMEAVSHVSPEQSHVYATVC